MQKAILVLLLAVGAAVAKPNLGSVTLPIINLPNVAHAIVDPAPAVLTGLPAVNAVIEYLKGTGSAGVTVQLPGGPLRLGNVALPTYLSCQTPLVENISCRICNIDCVAVHNTYGGICTSDPVHPDRDFVCVCQDDRSANGTVSTATDNCGQFFGKDLDPALDSALTDFLYVRETALLCTPEGSGTNSNAGCDTDCKTNHQYNAGNCQTTTTIPMTASETTGTKTGEYCICNY